MKYLSIILLVSILSISCSELLEEKIDNRTLVTSLEDMELAVNNLSPRADYLFTDMMTDDYAFKNIAGHLNNSSRDQIKPIFQLAITKQSFPKASFLSGGFNPYIAWRRYYYRINNSLFILNRISNYKPVNDEEIIRLNKVKAQCLAIKAYCNFMLVNLFAKQYDEASSNNDLGPPYVNAYSAKSVTIFDRISVKEYYDNIEADLKEALKYLDEDRTNKLYFNDIAVKALLSRLYLYKKDWDNCIKYTGEIILSKNNTSLHIKELYDTYIADQNNIAEYGKQYFNPSQESYLLVSNNTYQLISFYHHGYYPYPIRAFANTKNYTFGAIQTSPLFDDIIASKWNYFSRAGSQRLSIMMPLFTVAEMKLNLAEAYIYKQYFGKAKLLIKEIIDADNYSQSPDISSIGENKKDMIDFLLDTRRLRFFCEGMRWFDLKRYQLPVSHTTDAGTFEITGDSPDDYVIQPPVEEINFRDDYNK